MEYIIVCKNDPKYKGTDAYFGFNPIFFNHKEQAIKFYSKEEAEFFLNKNKSICKLDGHLAPEIITL